MAPDPQTSERAPIPREGEKGARLRSSLREAPKRRQRALRVTDQPAFVGRSPNVTVTLLVLVPRT